MLEVLKEIPLFSKSALLTALDATTSSGISLATLNTFISRSLKYGDLVHLKRGVYAPVDFFKKHAGSLGYLFFVANKLIEPSYVSMETALYYYELLTDTVNYTVFSVSRGRTVNFYNKLGAFKYRSIKEGLFTGYVATEIDNFKVFIAEPYKAIFDFLYFKLPFSGLREEREVLSALDYYRIKFDQLDKAQKNKFFKLIKNV